MFTGDVILSRGVSDELAIHGDSLLTNSFRIISSADFSIINLETVLTKKQRSAKEGYRFRYAPAVAEVLAESGVTHASLANNHSYDFGAAGLESTVNSLHSSNLRPLGVSCQPETLSLNGQRCAILAASLTSNNAHLCISGGEVLKARVKAFEADHADIPLILYLHWGLEYQPTPELWQRKLAHSLIELGADVILGHHPHVTQSWELYRGKPIVFSLGNFVADAYLPHTTEAVTAQVTISDCDIKVGLTPLDLTTYFPKKMSKTDEIGFLWRVLRFSPEVGLYRNGGQWYFDATESITFEEQASDWLFHLDDQDGALISTMSDGTMKLTTLQAGIPEKSMRIHGVLSEIEFADITNDGKIEMILGITKSVNFDEARKKRINVLRVDQGALRTVWLGTKFLGDILSFQVVTKGDKTYLQTSESDSSGNTQVRLYEWDEFGFALCNQPL